MNSGLDTEAIIRELVSASSKKKEKIEKEQTKTEWKQDAWKALNKKIKSFQSTISNLRFTDAFRKKTTTISNSSIASIVTGDNAVNGSQTLAVKQLAKSGYLTGGQLKNKSKGSTTLSELTKGTGAEIGKDDSASFTVKVGGQTTYIDLKGSSTVDEVLMKLNDAGVSASFDTTNQRFFISAKKSGERQDFSLGANDVNGLKALSGLGLLTQAELDKFDSKLAAAYDPSAGLDETLAASYITARGNAYAAGMQAKAASAQTVKGYFDAIEALKKDWEENPSKDRYEAALAKYGEGDYDKAKEGLAAARETLEAKRSEWAEKTEYLRLSKAESDLEEGQELSEAEKERLDALREKYDGQTITEESLQAEAEEIAESESELTADENAFKSYDSLQTAIRNQEGAIRSAAKNAKILNDYYAKLHEEKLNGIEGDTYQEKLANIEVQITEATNDGKSTKDLDDMKSLLTKMAANEAVYTAEGVKAEDYAYSETESLYNKAVKEITAEAQAAYEAVNNGGDYLSEGAVRIKGQDAKIELNGAEFTSDTNTFSINGLTITAKGESNVLGVDADGKPIYEQAQITTQNDVDGLYDMIKKVIKQYNELIKEIDGLYNAESAKGYDPLTSEEKAAMTDDEIEKWEEKIKGALLRHDSELGSVRNMLKQSMMGSFNIGGKNYSLADFGIFTQGYFEAEDDERSMLHIDGDSEDDVSAGNKDLLRKMLASSPDTVSKFFNQMSQKLYDSMSNASRTLKGVRSFGSFYSDKTLKSQYDSYKSKLKKQEEKVAKLEDKYYKMFSAMESAMAKTNSTSSYISSMFG